MSNATRFEFPVETMENVTRADMTQVMVNLTGEARHNFRFAVLYSDGSEYKGTCTAVSLRAAMAIVAEYYGTDDSGTDTNILGIHVFRD